MKGYTFIKWFIITIFYFFLDNERDVDIDTTSESIGTTDPYLD